jgi:hypothetical protein
MVTRRALIPRTAAALAAVGAVLAAPAQRAAQPAINVLQYVVSAGQREFTLLCLDGSQAGPIVKVLYSTQRQPDFYQDLDPALYRLIGNGWGLQLLSAWEGMARLMVLHS